MKTMIAIIDTVDQSKNNPSVDPIPSKPRQKGNKIESQSKERRRSGSGRTKKITTTGGRSRPKRKKIKRNKRWIQRTIASHLRWDQRQKRQLLTVEEESKGRRIGGCIYRQGEALRREGLGHPYVCYQPWMFVLITISPSPLVSWGDVGVVARVGVRRILRAHNYGVNGPRQLNLNRYCPD